MEVHGALGILAEFPVERWFREAMVLTIWEGTCHRQILDGLEVMERKAAHRLLFEQLREAADPIDLAEMRRRVDVHLPCRRRSARPAPKRCSAPWRYSRSDGPPRRRARWGLRH
jgi:acyl-CoA dehydrogenase